MKELFFGCGVALVTPFIDGKIDYKSFKNLIVNCLNNDANAIVILATTGEGSTITLSERIKLTRLAKRIINDRAKLIVGTGNNNFSDCYKLTALAKKQGADAALIVTPYYNKTTQDGIINFYDKLSEIGLPIIIYNVPARTGLSIELETIKKIIQTNKMVVGLKESTTDITRIIALHNICKDKIAIYSGEDNLNYLFYCLGANGTISVTANAFPKQVSKLYSLVKNNELKQANALFQSLSKIDNALFIETNPIPVKYLLKQLNLIASDEVRLPLVPLKNKQVINSLVKNYIKTHIS
ncbi:MAG: 4-hydroxy-tetrahydrodipicolinate synthase [Clostridia bacterium]|nr:4-hydroxy-tetrahydrodipicolinate synthase [Clostridia bacterium]